MPLRRVKTDPRSADGEPMVGWRRAFAAVGLSAALGACGGGDRPDPSSVSTTAMPVVVTAPPAADPSATSAEVVAVGVFQGCSSDGIVSCWGANDHGQLGQGHRLGVTGTVIVQDFSGATRLGVGDQHACSVADGSVWCWGMNDSGQLGVGDTTDRSRPTRAAFDPPADDVTALAVGDFHTCAVRGATRDLWCWGMNMTGAVDGTASDEPVTTPRRIDEMSGSWPSTPDSATPAPSSTAARPGAGATTPASRAPACNPLRRQPGAHSTPST